MDKKFEELKTVLSQEQDIYTSLAVTAEQMNRAIKAKGVDEVKQLTSRFDTCVVQVDLLEAKRLELCDAIAKEHKSEHQHLNLRRIITLLPEKEQKEFLDIRTSLKTKIHELSKVNISNQLLLKESLTAIGKKFELISYAQNIKSGYKHTGSMDTGQVRKSIVNQIA